MFMGIGLKRYVRLWILGKVINDSFGDLVYVMLGYCQLRSYFNEKSSGSRSRKQRLTAVGTRCADHVTPFYP